MPLYLHKSGEIKRTIPGRHEDNRVKDDPNWTPITAEQLAELRAAVDAEVQRDELAHEPPRR